MYGPTYVFSYNMSVVINSSATGSTLKNRHILINYNTFRWTKKAKGWTVLFESDKDNLEDLFANSLEVNKNEIISSCIL